MKNKSKKESKSESFDYDDFFKNKVLKLGNAISSKGKFWVDAKPKIQKIGGNQLLRMRGFE